MNPRIRVLIADDHPFMLSGICAAIDAENDMEVVATAEDGVEALSAFRRHKPDVSLIDIRMPKLGGLELIGAIRSLEGNARIIVLTTSACDAQVERAFRLGAMGYLLKHMVRPCLLQTIREVHAGKMVVPQEIAQLLATFALQAPLSPREVQILGKVSAGLSNKAIADSLQISEHTVKSYLKVILQKLDANDRTHAVTIAVQRGFLDLPVHGSKPSG
jgi:DNA-binding NarL/FixJ family response regulator